MIPLKYVSDQLRYPIHRLVNGCVGLHHNYMGPRPLCQQISNAKCHTPVADPGGGGGPGGPAPPPLGHDVGFLTLDPKLDPLLAPPPFCL